MIRFNVLKLMGNLEEVRGQKCTLKEVAAKSGCDKNALSRMVNHPEIIPSANVIDRLVQFFFFELMRDSEKPNLDRNRMKKAITEFISVYPDNEEYWSILPPEIRDNRDSMPLDAIWAVYARLHKVTREKTKLNLAEVQQAFKNKVLEADKAREEGAEVQLTLSAEEFELLLKKLPLVVGENG
jgi:hypothetical protein